MWLKIEMTSEKIPLVVDLDGTLIKEDIFFEMYVILLKQNPLISIFLLIRYFRTPEKLKSFLAENIPFEIEALTFNEYVLDIVRDAKSSGRETVLATASFYSLAEKVAVQIGMFDRVYGTTSNLNLRGKHKSDLLSDIYGKEKFDYIGNDKTDLVVWENARNIIAVNFSANIEKSILSLNKPTQFIQGKSFSWLELLKASRPSNWIKNLLVFAPLLFAHNFDLFSWLNGLFAFLIFCLLASSVYFLNDVCDIQEDRKHPLKCERPIPKGSVSIKSALLSCICLGISGFAISFIIFDIHFMTVAVVYMLMTTAYSLFFKKLFLADVLTLVALFLIRILAGGEATNIEPSTALLFVSASGFFSLALIKRIAELSIIRGQNVSKLNGRAYSVEDKNLLFLISSLSTFFGICGFGKYITSDLSKLFYPSPEYLYLSVIIIIATAVRMHSLAKSGKMIDDPVYFLFKDSLSKISAILIAACFILGAIP